MSNKPRRRIGLIEWLGFRDQWSYSDLRWLGYLLGAFLFLLAFLVVCASFAMLVHFFLALFTQGPYADDKAGEGIRNIGLVLAALFGAPFLVWRSIVLAQQAQTAAEALFNDKINAAVQELSARREVTRVVTQNGGEEVLRVWEDDLVSRVAAIDRLEGLVAEREYAAPRIVRLLATYIRGNFQCRDLEPTEGIEIRKVPRMDLQKAIDCIGRILKTAAEIDDGHWRLDLTDCDFDGVNFATGNFRAVNFYKSRFEASIFDEGVFEGCYFVNTLLNYSSFRSTNLRGARFDRAIINRPEPVAGGFVQSINMGDLTGAIFTAADLSAIDYLGEPAEIAKTFGTKDTVLSDDVHDRKPDDRSMRRAYALRNQSDRRLLTDEEKAEVDGVEATGFLNWSPFDSTDGTTGHLEFEFRNRLGMNSWPFTR